MIREVIKYKRTAEEYLNLMEQIKMAIKNGTPHPGRLYNSELRIFDLQSKKLVEKYLGAENELLNTWTIHDSDRDWFMDNHISDMTNKIGILNMIIRLNSDSTEIEIPDTTLEKREIQETNTKRDVFICHASEDKSRFVLPLIEELSKNNISYWYDNTEIKWGDSIVKKVNQGLLNSEYVIVVISNFSIIKHWPNHELESALNIEISSGYVKVLPVILGDAKLKNEILKNYPILNSKLHLSWNDEKFDEIISRLKERL